MNPLQVEQPNESAPFAPSARSKPFVPVSEVGQTFGTKYFLVSILLASVIPIIELGIGLYYKGQCPINQNIPTYMIVAGVLGLVLVGLSLIVSITFLCFIPDSVALTLLASCSLCLNVAVTFLISLFLFIWFIIGCVWVFGIRNQVQFYDRSNRNYCDPVLYKGTFALLVITIVWACIQCCVSCFRPCFSKRDVK